MPEYSPDQLTAEDRAAYDALSPEDRNLFDEENRKLVQEYNDPQYRAGSLAEIDREVMQLERSAPIRFESEGRRLGFWGEDEDDELGMEEDGDDNFYDDEITSSAHAEVELHREMRDYARIAAWDMPLLSSKLFHLIHTFNFALFFFFFFPPLTDQYRTCKTIRTSARNARPPLPLYHVHGRTASSGTQSRCGVLLQGPNAEISQRRPATNPSQTSGNPLQSRKRSHTHVMRKIRHPCSEQAVSGRSGQDVDQGSKRRRLIC